MHHGNINLPGVILFNMLESLRTILPCSRLHNKPTENFPK